MLIVLTCRNSVRRSRGAAAGKDAILLWGLFCNRVVQQGGNGRGAPDASSRMGCARSTISGVTAIRRHSARQGSCTNGCHRIPVSHLPAHSRQPPFTQAASGGPTRSCPIDLASYRAGRPQTRTSEVRGQRAGVRGQTPGFRGGFRSLGSHEQEDTRKEERWARGELRCSMLDTRYSIGGSIDMEAQLSHDSRHRV